MNVPCPDCGKAVKEQGLGPHRRLAHGYRRVDPPRPEADADGVFRCPSCGKGFRMAASLGTHRRLTHGVVGTSKAAATRTRKKGARTPAKSVAVAPSRYCALGRHKSCTTLFGGFAPCGCACHPPPPRRRRSTVTVIEQPTPPSAEGFSGPQA